jgi:hypothetical protein
VIIYKLSGAWRLKIPSSFNINKYLAMSSNQWAFIVASGIIVSS